MTQQQPPTNHARPATRTGRTVQSHALTSRRCLPQARCLWVQALRPWRQGASRAPRCRDRAAPTAPPPLQRCGRRWLPLRRPRVSRSPNRRCRRRHRGCPSGTPGTGRGAEGMSGTGCGGGGVHQGCARDVEKQELGDGFGGRGTDGPPHPRHPSPRRNTKPTMGTHRGNGAGDSGGVGNGWQGKECNAQRAKARQVEARRGFQGREKTTRAAPGCPRPRAPNPLPHPRTWEDGLK
jgi:hypothetical protein